MCEAVERDDDPRVAWYRDELEPTGSWSDWDALDDPDDPDDPDVPVDAEPLETRPLTAMADPSPTKATTLEAAATLRARPAGCRRRRPDGIVRSGLMGASSRSLARSLSTDPGRHLGGSLVDP